MATHQKYSEVSPEPSPCSRSPETLPRPRLPAPDALATGSDALCTLASVRGCCTDPEAVLKRFAHMEVCFVVSRGLWSHCPAPTRDPGQAPYRHVHVGQSPRRDSHVAVMSPGGTPAPGLGPAPERAAARETKPAFDENSQEKRASPSGCRPPLDGASIAPDLEKPGPGGRGRVSTSSRQLCELCLRWDFGGWTLPGTW